MTQTGTNTAGNPPTPVVAPVVIPVQPVPSAPPTHLKAPAPTGRLAAELEDRWRVVAAVVAGLSLVYGGILAWREESNGAAVAALFGVGIISLIFALAGVVPASVKLGDLEVKLEQAKEQAKEEGKQEGKVEGRQEGSLDGLQAAAKIAELSPAKSAEIRDQVKDSLTQALSSEAPLTVPELNLTLAVPKLERADAQMQAEAITDALM